MFTKEWIEKNPEEEAERRRKIRERAKEEIKKGERKMPKRKYPPKVRIVCKTCGKVFEVIPSRAKTAKYHSKECHNQAKRSLVGKENPHWKGGKTLSRGYIYINNGERYVREHRQIIEDAIGHKLKKGDEVHHIDYNKENNVLSNLCILSKDEHSRCGASILKLIPKLLENKVICFDNEEKLYRMGT